MQFSPKRLVTLDSFEKIYLVIRRMNSLHGKVRDEAWIRRKEGRSIARVLGEDEIFGN